MFSIIIPCYNVEKSINKTVKSVLVQQFKDFELILVNDGSTDKTYDLLNNLKSIDNRIVVIHKSNKGVSSARNSGFECAKGDYVYFLDADDLIEPDLLQNAYISFNNSKNIDIFSFGYDIKDNNNTRDLSFPKYNNQFFEPALFLRMYFSKQIRQHLCSTLYRKDLIQSNGLHFPEDTAYGEDQDFQLKAILHSRGIYYSSVCYYHYIKRAGSAVNKKIPLKRLDLLRMLNKLEIYFNNKIADKKIMNSLNNYQCITYFFLILEGLKKNGNKEYFNQLIQYSSCLKKAKFELSKYALLAFAISKMCFFIPKTK